MVRLALLTTSNPKTAKGKEHGYAVAVLHLAPARLSGFNVCPQASAGCIAGCLNLAGRGGLSAGGVLTHSDVEAGRTNAVQAARIRRTRWLFADRAGFLAALEADIARWAAWCEANGFRPAVRLNGTSDLAWEAIAPHLFRRFPSVQFYDYTKVVKRALRWARGEMPANYHLTFSLSETNVADAARVLAAGGNVAVVYRVAKSADLPASDALAGNAVRNVVDGDAHDLRFLDPRGSIVGLRAKGWAKRDTTGFVRDPMHNTCRAPLAKAA